MAALSNANEARQVVFNLFQDLEGFSLDDYKPFSDLKPGLDRVLEFLRAALTAEGKRLEAGDGRTRFRSPAVRFRLHRGRASRRRRCDSQQRGHLGARKQYGIYARERIAQS